MTLIDQSAKLHDVAKQLEFLSNQIALMAETPMRYDFWVLADLRSRVNNQEKILFEIYMSLSEFSDEMRKKALV